MNNKLRLLNDENERIWQILATKLFLTDSDKILTMGVHPTPEYVAITRTINLLSEEVGNNKYNLIVSNSALSSISCGDVDNIYSYGFHFEAVEKLLNNESPSIYAMWHPITNRDDATLNALISSLDSDHVRFPKVDEIISAGGSTLILNEYLKINTQRVYTFSDKRVVDTHISNMADNLLQMIDPTVTTVDTDDENKHMVTVNVQAGLFIWSNC